jgi:HEAT repeat protein
LPSFLDSDIPTFGAEGRMNDLALLTILLFVGPPPPACGFEEDLVYEGRPLREWLLDIRGNDPAARRRASRVLRLVGPEAHEAVPALLMAMKTDDAVARYRLSRTLARMGPRTVPLLSASIRFENAQLTQGAARALAILGPEARPATRALTHELKSSSPDVRILSALALWQADRRTTGLPTLRAALAGTSGSKQWAAWALARFGPAAAPAAPDLVRLLADRDDSVRDWVFRALEAIGPDAVPALTQGCKSVVPGVRVEAAEALGRIGPGADSAVPTLLPLLQDTSAGPRVAAARALGRIAPESDAVVARLRETLRENDNDLRLESARALGAFGSRASSAIPELRVAVKDPVRRVRNAAARALVRIGKPSVHALVELLKDNDHLVRRQALLALRDLGPDAIAAVPALTTALADSTTSLRPLAIEALAAIGSPGVSPLVKLFQDDSSADLRTRAASALARIGPRAAGARQALTDTLRDKTPGLRPATIAALGAMGPEARPAVSALVKLYEEEVALRFEILAALGRIRPEAKDGLPLFRKALADDRIDIRGAALMNLDALGAEARPAAADVVARLEDANAGVRHLAALALVRMSEGKQALPAIKKGLESAVAIDRERALWMAGGLGPVARELLPSIRARLTDDHADVRLVAVWALGEVDALDKTVLDGLQKQLANPLRLLSRPGPQLLSGLGVFRLLARLGADARPAVPALRHLLDKETNLILRLEAARTLGAIGPAAREALPALFRLLRDIDRDRDIDSDEILDALSLNKPGEARMNRLVVVADADLRRDADRALLHLRKSGLGDMTAVDAVLSEAASLLRQEVLSAIARIGPAAVSPASADLRSESAGARRRAATVLVHLGPAAREAVPALRATLQDRNPAVAVEAAAALHAVAGEKDALLDMLIDGLSREDEVPLRAAKVLRQIGPAATRAVPALQKALRHPRGKVREEAARALGAIRPESKQAREALRERLRDPRDRVRVQAALSLRALDATFDPLPVLLAVLRETDSSRSRPSCVKAILSLGKAAKPALPHLHALLADPNDQVRLLTAQALWKLSKDASVVDGLAAIAANSRIRSSVRLSALKVLADMGTTARPALPLLHLAIRDATSTTELRQQVHDTLKAIQ